ncbi:MAG: FAD-dependent monooxygenase, partial [Hymenobacter sp.]|nr:FAD-dependent monooxygenase [Hymenobacter sp.]
MLETDICILGAGPGGATAALHLANAGQPCLLLDRATFPRDKVCGDALSGKVLVELRRIDAALPARLEAAPQQIPSWGIDFYAPNGRKLTVPFKASYNTTTDHAAGHISKRLDFDNFLIEEVRRRPEIELREGVDVSQHEQQP